MNKIAAALVKAQKSFAPALKSSANAHFKSKYADLAACVEAVIDSLNSNGIALIQKQHPSDGGVMVETIFLHESGEVFSAGMLAVPASKQDPQGYGSALTYARRYSLMAACGIAPEDDDGNAASRRKPEKPGVIKATDGAGSSLSDERKAEIDELALYMIESHQAGKDMDAIAIWYGDTLKDNDERVYCWSLLGSASKLRAVIKANKPESKT